MSLVNVSHVNRQSELSNGQIIIYTFYTHFFLQWNLHTDSLNDVIDRVFGKYGSWSKRKSIFDMMKEKRTKETLDYTKLELTKLKQKVRLID